MPERTVIEVDIEYIKKRVDGIDKKLEHHYVTQAEFEPIKKLVYGLVALILTGVVGALMALLLRI